MTIITSLLFMTGLNVFDTKLQLRFNASAVQHGRRNSIITTMVLLINNSVFNFTLSNLDYKLGNTISLFMRKEALTSNDTSTETLATISTCINI